MSDRPTGPLELYAWLKQQISELDAELDSLKESVFSSVDSTGGIFEKDNYAIRSQKRPKYKFSTNYATKNDELKALKKSEIDEGIATIDGYSEFVTIKFKKKDDAE